MAYRSVEYTDSQGNRRSEAELHFHPKYKATKLVPATILESQVIRQLTSPSVYNCRHHRFQGADGPS